MFPKSKYTIGVLLFLNSISLCFGQQEVVEDSSHIKSYLFLAHTYASDSTLNPQLNNVKYEDFDQIWLGGDILGKTYKSSKNLNYLDSLFDLSSPNTKWTLGNRDYIKGKDSLIVGKTRRPLFYSANEDGITYLVLNTNGLGNTKTDTSFINEQYRMIEAVCDTISKSSHLVILSHHVLWNQVDAMKSMPNIANHSLAWVKMRTNPERNYYWSVYKKHLVAVQKRGVQVVHVAGDFGTKRTKFEYKTSDGIYLLGSGILHETNFNRRYPNFNKPDSILTFKHNIKKRKLTWKFQELPKGDPTKKVINKKYLFLSHIYESESKINKQLNGINFKKFDQVWLGGDLLTETTKNRKNLEYLDNLFDLSNPNTKWALGNHDIRNGNIPWITEKTKRPTYYTTHSDGITYIVLNTNGLDYREDEILNMDSSFANSQYRMIKRVCDTISKSSHLVILSHHVLWNQVDSMELMDKYANLNAAWFKIKTNPISNYYWGIYYRQLLRAQRRGVQVVHLAGDFGQKRSAFEYKTSNGVYLLGSGILPDNYYNRRFPNYKKTDSILIFNHDLTNRELTWKFLELPNH